MVPIPFFIFGKEKEKEKILFLKNDVPHVRNSLGGDGDYFGCACGTDYSYLSISVCPTI